MRGELKLEQGWISERLAEEFPQLRVVSALVAAAPAQADPGVAERLGYLASRFNGRRAVELRREPVPAAYRVFFRHIGLDPDVTRTPIEQAALARLVEGGHLSRGRLADALLLALLETGVPVSAFDAAAVSGPVGLREAGRGEVLAGGERPAQLEPGRLVLADADRPLGELFADIAQDALPSRTTQALRLVVVQVPHVPQTHTEEALWTCAEALKPSA